MQPHSADHSSSSNPYFVALLTFLLALFITVFFNSKPPTMGPSPHTAENATQKEGCQSSNFEPFPWNLLPDELKVRSVKFLPCRERYRVSVAAKSVQKACVDATACFPNISNAIMPESLGRAFCAIINSLRTAVFSLGLAGKLSPQAEYMLGRDDLGVEELLRRNMHEDMLLLNSSVFSYWHSDFSGLPGSGVFSAVKAASARDPERGLGPHLGQAECWPQSRLHGKVYVLLERPDGTVVVEPDSLKVYLTLGMQRSVGRLLLEAGHRLPQLAMATFLPFHGYIAFDGLVMGGGPPLPPQQRRRLYRAYCRAVDGGSLLSSLPLRPSPAPSASPSAGPEGGAPALSPAQTRLLQHLAALPKPASPRHGPSWVLRRFGYSEADNPAHLVVVMSSQGLPVTVQGTRALQPTALELFDILCSALFGDQPAAGGSQQQQPCPAVVMTDELTALAPLQALLQPSGLPVRYYPPPTPEEELCIQAVGGCANCHIDDRSLRLQRQGLGEGEGGLRLCQRCRKAQYCSRACQKAHWKQHKKVCGK